MAAIKEKRVLRYPLSLRGGLCNVDLRYKGGGLQRASVCDAGEPYSALKDTSKHWVLCPHEMHSIHLLGSALRPRLIVLYKNPIT